MVTLLLKYLQGDCLSVAIIINLSRRWYFKKYLIRHRAGADGAASFFLLLPWGLLSIFTCGSVFLNLDLSSFCFSKVCCRAPSLLIILALPGRNLIFSCGFNYHPHADVSHIFAFFSLPSYFVLPVCNPFSFSFLLF